MPDNYIDHHALCLWQMPAHFATQRPGYWNSDGLMERQWTEEPLQVLRRDGVVSTFDGTTARHAAGPEHSWNVYHDDLKQFQPLRFPTYPVGTEIIPLPLACAAQVLGLDPQTAHNDAEFERRVGEQRALADTERTMGTYPSSLWQPDGTPIPCKLEYVTRAGSYKVDDAAIHPALVDHVATMHKAGITMSQLSKLPAGVDPFDPSTTPEQIGAASKPSTRTAPPPEPGKSVTIAPDDPFYELAADMVGNPERIEQIAKLIEQGSQYEGMRVRAEAATKANATLEEQRKEADATIQSLQAALQAAQAQASHAPLPQPMDDDGKPIPGAMTPPPDPAFIEPSWWTADAAPILANWGQYILLEQGPAGVGKSYAPEQFAARDPNIAYVYLNCKTSDPHEFIEYRSIGAGGETRFDQGPLTAALTARTSKRVLVVLDEFDTTPVEFQMRMAQALEANPAQRKLVTVGNGSIQVGRHVQFILTANATGLNPSSRHRGSIAPPILNRSVAVQVDLPTPQELTRILNVAAPATSKDNKRVATIVLRLMQAVDRGEIDMDVTLRTGIQAAQLHGVYKDWTKAWNRALLDKIDDPTMKGKATSILQEQFK